MAASFCSLLILLFWTSQMNLPSTSGRMASDPHFGDIQLKPCENEDLCHDQATDSVIGTLMVFFGMESEVPVWSTVCKNGFVDLGGLGSTAICKILGYEQGEYWQGTSGQVKAMRLLTTEDSHIALTALNCAKQLSNGYTPNHLLRCDYSIYFSKDGYFYKQDGVYDNRVFTLSKQSGFNSPYDQDDCSGLVYLKCSQQTGIPLPETTVASSGQVGLCPPDEVMNSSSYPSLQISFGLISVFHNNFWGSVNQNSTIPFGKFEADSVCRALGFTEAVADSIRTVKSYDRQYNFSTCLNSPGMRSRIEKVWLTTKQAQGCDDHASACFSCCYKNPDPVHGECTLDVLRPDGSCPINRCCDENDIVVECVFDNTASSPPEAGNVGLCHSVSEGVVEGNVCATNNGKTFSLSTLLIATLIPSIAFVILFVFTILLMIIGIGTIRRIRHAQPAAVNDLPPAPVNALRNPEGNEGGRNPDGIREDDDQH